MDVTATEQLPGETGADTVVVGLVEGEGIPHDTPTGNLGALVDSGEARAKAERLAHTHAAGKRWIVVGLGAREELDAERVRRAAAVALGRARELGARDLCWEVPHKVDDALAGAIVEGTLLAAYRFDRFKSAPDDDGPGPRTLTVSAHHDVSGAVARAATVARAANFARDLQNTPANEMTPAALAEAALGLDEQLTADAGGTLAVDTIHGEAIAERGMGCFAAVARGSYEPPALITVRYEPEEEARGPVLGLVGKAVTFDTGGISLKSANKMSEMKYDMSGGAAVLGAVRAIAELRLPVRVVAVVGATENMPSGRSVKPGDVVRALNGTTVEVVNTDAEGRLVLADCLAHAVELGAERLVDVATLTGAIITALGGVHCGLMASDDAWAQQVERAAAQTGELAWRLPLHPAYDEALRSQVADVANLDEGRKGASIVAATFLRRFTGEVPWAHLDIAGTAWNTGRPYAPKGGSGFGVRLLVELATSLA